MPWVDLTSVTLMAFVFAATPKEEQMSPSPLHTHSHRHSSDFIIKLKSACTHIEQSMYNSLRLMEKPESSRSIDTAFK